MKRKMIMAMLLCASFAAAAGCSTFAEAVAETEAVEETEAQGTKYEVEEIGEKPEYKALDYVTVGEYKGLAVEIEEVVVNDDDVEYAMEEAINDAVEDKELYTKGEGTVEDGDVANIDFVGKIDGTPFDGGTGTGYDLEIGSGSFIDGFEEQLIGVKTGDTVDVNVSFPEDYWSEDLAGAPAVFTVTVNYIKTTPEMTDALVSDATDGEYTTIDAYAAHMREELEEEAKDDQEAEIENELLTQLYNTCSVNEYPQELVDYSVKSARNYYIQMSEAYGMNYEDLLTQFGMASDEEFVSVLQEDVKESLIQEMLLRAIAETEELTVSEDDYKEGAQKYVEGLGYESIEALEADYSHAEIEEAILMTKTMDLVRENAVITYVEPGTEDYEDLFSELEFETGDYEELEFETDDFEFDEDFFDEEDMEDEDFDIVIEEETEE